jgi:hypothetical protein
MISSTYGDIAVLPEYPVGCIMHVQGQQTPQKMAQAVKAYFYNTLQQDR